MERVFKGKVAIVSGARTGMGFATAQRFAEMGAAVVMAGRNEPVAEAQALQSKGLQETSVKCDVLNYEDCVRMVETALKEFGRLKFAFNNA